MIEELRSAGTIHTPAVEQCAEADEARWSLGGRATRAIFIKSRSSQLSAVFLRTSDDPR